MKYIIGIDEVGRGPIAGPVTLGAFVFLDKKAKKHFRGVKESKQLSFAQRESWYSKIIEQKKKGNIDFVVCFSSNKEIDNKGMSWSINKCLVNCLLGLKFLKSNNCKIILDGGLHAPKQYQQKTIIKGDEKFIDIALASIVAKVSRDHLMIKFANKYPLYGFDKHMGYGTKAHRDIIEKHGPSPIHRRSFMKNIIKKSKYLVTGGQGFIGQNVVKLTGGVSFDLASGLDIRDIDALRANIEQGQEIFHLAAKISVPESFENEREYFETNVIGLKNLVEIAKEKNNKIVFSSSAAVYGNTSFMVNEDGKVGPLSPYASNKLEGENILKESGLNAVCLRYFNVYGPGQSSAYAGVITNFINKAKKGEDLIIFGDGNQVRDFVHVEDVARANLLAMKYLENTKDGFQIFNIGSGEEVTIRELAQMIIDLTGSKSKIVYAKPRQGDIYYSCADITKAKAKLDFSPKINLKKGLEDLI